VIRAAYLADLIVAVLKDTPFPDLDRALPLLLGTAAQESNLVHFRQLNNGPARGLFQMEPATERDHAAYVANHKDIANTFLERCNVLPASLWHLENNLVYQILLARLHYYRRDPKRLPEAQDIAEQSLRYKKYYNTAAGKATPEQYVANYQRLIAPHML
jgi:hypothetical protein